MTDDFKPGDVAMVACSNDGGCSTPEHPAIYGKTGSWWLLDRGEYDFDVQPFRRLVVIDPEDREQAERLLSGYAGWKNSGDIAGNPHYVDDMQAALREFANPTPPKPEEPTGLGAVVEDADGVLWVRVHDEECPDHGWQPRNGFKYLWADVPAVRVLSEGVTP